MGGVYNPFNLNLYAYGYQNPVKYIDPDGRIIKLAPKLTEEQRGQIIDTMQKLTNDKLEYNPKTRQLTPSKTSPSSTNKPKGTELIRRLHRSKRTVTIHIGYEGNKEMDANPRNASNGIGTDTTVNFDPTSNPAIMTVDPKTGRVSRQRGRPNQIGLGHELIHSDHIMSGEVDFNLMSHSYKTRGGTKTQIRPIEELRTVGVKGVRQGDITENQLRREQDQPLRGAY